MEFTASACLGIQELEHARAVNSNGDKSSTNQRPFPNKVGYPATPLLHRQSHAKTQIATPCGLVILTSCMILSGVSQSSFLINSERYVELPSLKYRRVCRKLQLVVPASLAPSANAFLQSSGKTVLRRFRRSSGSK